MLPCQQTLAWEQSGLGRNVLSPVALENFQVQKFLEKWLYYGWIVQLLNLNTNKLRMSWGLLPVEPVSFIEVSHSLTTHIRNRKK